MMTVKYCDGECMALLMADGRCQSKAAMADGMTAMADGSCHQWQGWGMGNGSRGWCWWQCRMLVNSGGCQWIFVNCCNSRWLLLLLLTAATLLTADNGDGRFVDNKNKTTLHMTTLPR
jgi:hypothetical protein